MPDPKVDGRPNMDCNKQYSAGLGTGRENGDVSLAALTADLCAVANKAFKALDVRVARIEARLETLIEQLRDLNAALRWMRPMPDRGAEA